MLTYIIFALILLLFCVYVFFVKRKTNYDFIYYPIKESDTNIKSLQNHKNNNLYIDKSTYELDGHGLFTSVDINTGDIVYASSTNEDILSTLMNDADFEYPSEWTYDLLDECFKKYIITNRCNLDIYNHDNNIIYFRANRNIKKGEELTKRYGIDKWTKFLMGECLGAKMSQLKKNIMLDTDHKKLDILTQVGKKYHMIIENKN